MKLWVLLTLILFCHLPINAFPLKQENKICFSVSLNELDKNKLFLKVSINNFIKQSVKYVPNYHLGLACIIMHEHFDQYYPLKRFIGEKITRHFEEKNIVFIANRVDRYLVGSERNFYKSSLVIYPQNPDNFLKFNRLIFTELQKWNNLNHTQFYFHEDYELNNYKPHITILSEDVFKEYFSHEVDAKTAVEEAKKAIIGVLKPQISDEVFKFQVPHYKYK
ncbi:MAG: hypothetical protein O2897_02200 [bacterium]|nr:hypothetical protein [bacterium]